MGQEITTNNFTLDDFSTFHHRLVAETEILKQWAEQGKLRASTPVGGSEIEAWLVGAHGRPASINQAFLDDLKNPLVVPELATFNVELNTPPLPLGPGMLDRLHADLQRLWLECEQVANKHQAQMLATGILPTVRQADLCLENISSMQRYQALNEQVLVMRRGKPIQLDIEGREHLQVTHQDVMLEAAATSFQIHLKVDIQDAVAAYNHSKLISAAMVALSANSPYLFGHDLWAESRIPLFEQAVSVGWSDYSKRVTFGLRYAEQSIIECFEANRDRYPILLPHLMDEAPEQLAHLRLHNGTIWRWNRPLIGFSESGAAHLRIEHRVAPSGPTILDMVANAAFYFGFIQHRLKNPVAPDVLFDVAQDNFYRCARNGLLTKVTWTDGRSLPIRELILEQLLPMANQGLVSLGMPESETRRWLDIIRKRVECGQNGATWQRAWVQRYGPDFESLVQVYHDNQQSGHPIHEWQI